MINFKKFQDKDEDYLLMMKWLNNSYVRQWYGSDDFPKPPNLNDIRKKYRKKVLNSNKHNPNIILIDDIPIGYIQYYETKEYLYEENVYGIDIFIGEDDYRGKGYGSKILKQIINTIFEKPNIEKIVIDPDVENKIAIKCYLNVGFKKVKEINGHLIMMINK